MRLRDLPAEVQDEVEEASEERWTREYRARNPALTAAEHLRRLGRLPEEPENR